MTDVENISSQFYADGIFSLYSIHYDPFQKQSLFITFVHAYFENFSEQPNFFKCYNDNARHF